MDSFSTRSPPNEDNVDPSGTYDEYDYQHALEVDRRLNDQRLKSRFEEIFRKYEHDFSGVGDEIDLETGEIVVNNGHLETLQHETDPGKGESLRLMCALAGSLEEDDIDSEDSSGPEESSDDQSIVEGMLAEAPEKHTPKTVKPSYTRVKDTALIDPQLRDDETRALLTPGESASEDGRAYSEPVQLPEPAIAHEKLLDGADSEAAFDEISCTGEGHLDTLKSIMNELKATVDNETSSDAIKTIGVKIAAQLSELVARSKESISADRVKESSDPVWAFPELPQDLFTREKQPRHTRLRPQADARSTTEADLLRDSIWAPVIAPHHYKKTRKRRKLTRSEPVQDSEALFAKPASVENMQIDSGSEGAANTSIQVTKGCSHCGIQVTTVWRRGPSGELCNACGMYYYRYGELKPTDETDISSASTSESEGESKRPVKLKSFSVNDDALVIKLKEIDNMPWDEIGKQFAGRSWWSVQGRYSRHLHDAPCAGRQLLIEQGYPLHIDRYTPSEDDLLLQLRNDEKLDWAVIADRLIGHSKESIEIRHDFLSGRFEIPPPVRRKTAKKNYSAEEDDMIIKLREVEKMSWERMGEMYPGRTSSSLQKRYTRALQRRVHKNTADHQDALTVDRHTADAGDLIAKGPNTPDGISEPPSAVKPQMVEHKDLDLSIFQESLLEESHIDPRLLGMEPSHPGPSLHPGSEGRDDELIRDLRDNHGLDWDMIQLWVPGSTVASLQERYYAPPVTHDVFPSTSMQDQQIQGDHMQRIFNDTVTPSFVPPGDSPVDQITKSRRPPGKGKFSKSEDNAIINGKAHQMSWDEIEANFPTDRPLEKIIKRWHKLEPPRLETMANRSISSYNDTRSSAVSFEGETTFVSRRPLLESSTFPRVPQSGTGASLNLFNSFLESNNIRDPANSIDIDQYMCSDGELEFDLLNMAPITAVHRTLDTVPISTADDARGPSHEDVQEQHSFSPAEVSETLSRKPVLQVGEAEISKSPGLESKDANLGSPEFRESLPTDAGRSALPSLSNQTSPNPNSIGRRLANINGQVSHTAERSDDIVVLAEGDPEPVISTVINSTVNPSGDDAARPVVVNRDAQPSPIVVRDATPLTQARKTLSPVTGMALKMTPKSTRKPRRDTKEEKDSTNRKSHRRQNLQLQDIVTPSLMATGQRSHSSASLKASRKGQRRISRRRSESRRLEVPDTDASDCSWDSKQNSSASDTDEDASFERHDDDIDSPSPVKRLGRLQHTGLTHLTKTSSKKSSVKPNNLSKQSSVAEIRRVSAAKVANTPSKTTPTTARAQGNLPTSAIKSTYTKFVPGSETKRIVDTPMKEIHADSSEDELA